MGRDIFLYGTLQKPLARGCAAGLAAVLGQGRPGWTRGSLHLVRDAQGAYPALLRGYGKVAGTVYQLPAEPGWLARVDAYEGCRRADPAGSEYIRRPLRVILCDGRAIGAQAYFYNRLPRDAGEHIAHGDFARFIRETGLPLLCA